MARINITRLPLPQDDFDRQQQDILIRELENIINQLNFTFQQDLREESTAVSYTHLTLPTSDLV